MDPVPVAPGGLWHSRGKNLLVEETRGDSIRIRLACSAGKLSARLNSRMSKAVDGADRELEPESSEILEKLREDPVKARWR